MIKYIFILLTGFLASIVTGCDNTNLTRSISMVPRPAQMMPGSGNHLFSDQTVVAVENEEQAEIAREMCIRDRFSIQLLILFLMMIRVLWNQK